MASKAVVCTYVGIFLFLVMILTQMGFLLALQLWYLPFSKVLLGSSLLYLFLCLYLAISALFMTRTAAGGDTGHLRLSTVIWTGYVVFILVPNIIAIFGHAVQVHGLLEDGSFLASYLLKRLICVPPFALLLLINTTANYEWYLSLQMSIDLFDITEMLVVVLESTGQENGPSQKLSLTMIGVACFGYLLTSMHMEETKFVAGVIKTRFITTLVRNILQMVVVNSSFLLFRLSLEHWKDKLIFISKNVIGIFYSLWTIINLLLKRHKCYNYVANLTDGSE